MTRPFGFFCLAALVLSACPAKTDYGQTCQMTKPKGEAACQVEIPGSADICGISTNETKPESTDFVSLGNAECDDQVCLRTAVKCEVKEDCPAGMPDCVNGYCTYADSNDNAVGYCTRGCLDDSDCQPDFQGGKGLVCTALFFSPEYLSLLQAACETDPNCLYNQIFGSGVQSKYCLRPRGDEK